MRQSELWCRRDALVRRLQRGLMREPRTQHSRSLDLPVYITALEVFETFNPGHVTRILAQRLSSKLHKGVQVQACSIRIL